MHFDTGLDVRKLDTFAAQTFAECWTVAFYKMADQSTIKVLSASARILVQVWSGCFVFWSVFFCMFFALVRVNTRRGRKLQVASYPKQLRIALNVPSFCHTQVWALRPFTFPFPSFPSPHSTWAGWSQRKHNANCINCSRPAADGTAPDFVEVPGKLHLVVLQLLQCADGVATNSDRFNTNCTTNNTFCVRAIPIADCPNPGVIWRTWQTGKKTPWAYSWVL